MALQDVQEYLDKNEVKYVVIRHSRAFTAQEVAASAHIKGKEMAKTVILKVDGNLKMLVLPSTHQVDFDQFKDATGANRVSLAQETEFEDRFPDCELGAMPPFGNIYDIETYVAESLTEDDEIAFNAGTHKDCVKMSYSDYEKLVQPSVVPASVKQA